MGGLLGTIAGFFGSVLTSSVARFLALKVVLTTLFITVLPLVLKHIIIWVSDGLLSSFTGVLPSDVQSFVIQLSGLSGYLANQLRLVEAVSIILSALCLRFTLSSLKTIL